MNTTWSGERQRVEEYITQTNLSNTRGSDIYTLDNKQCVRIKKNPQKVTQDQ